MTSTYSTVVNFSMHDILKRLTRIELILNSVQNANEVGVQNKNLSDQDSSSNHQNNFNFPRFNKHSRHFINASKFHSTLTETATCETMSDSVIDNICTLSLSDVKQTANILGNKKNNKNLDKMCINRTSHHACVVYVYDLMIQIIIPSDVNRFYSVRFPNFYATYKKIIFKNNGLNHNVMKSLLPEISFSAWYVPMLRNFKICSLYKIIKQNVSQG